MVVRSLKFIPKLKIFGAKEFVEKKFDFRGIVKLNKTQEQIKRKMYKNFNWQIDKSNNKKKKTQTIVNYSSFKSGHKKYSVAVAVFVFMSSLTPYALFVSKSTNQVAFFCKRKKTKIRLRWKDVKKKKKSTIYTLISQPQS